MKLHLLLITTASSLYETSSFVVRMTSSAFAPTSLRSINDEAHMEVMPKIWDELRKSEKDIVIQQQVGEISQSEASMAMAEQLLETALDYVRTKEHIEEDLANRAHKTFQHAADNEKVLKEHIVADDKLDIPLDSYLEERFHEAQDMEREAHEEEMEHLNNWAELRMEEEAIKSAIKELKDLNKEMDDLDFMRNNLA